MTTTIIQIPTHVFAESQTTWSISQRPSLVTNLHKLYIRNRSQSQLPVTKHIRTFNLLSKVSLKLVLYILVGNTVIYTSPNKFRPFRIHVTSNLFFVYVRIIWGKLHAVETNAIPFFHYLLRDGLDHPRIDPGKNQWEIHSSPSRTREINWSHHRYAPWSLSFITTKGKSLRSSSSKACNAAYDWNFRIETDDKLF